MATISFPMIAMTSERIDALQKVLYDSNAWQSYDRHTHQLIVRDMIAEARALMENTPTCEHDQVAAHHVCGDSVRSAISKPQLQSHAEEPCTLSEAQGSFPVSLGSSPLPEHIYCPECLGPGGLIKADRHALITPELCDKHKQRERLFKKACAHPDSEIDDSVIGDYRCKVCDERWWWDPRT